MKRLNAQEFSIRRIAEATDTTAPQSQLLVNGNAIESFIEGAILEACIQYLEFLVIFTTNDCPYEESLNIHLLSPSYEILDSATLAWPYGTGSFKILDIVEPNIIEFQFFVEKPWQIELFPEQRLLFPFLREPRGVWRKFKLRCHFKVREKPTPNRNN